MSILRRREKAECKPTTLVWEKHLVSGIEPRKNHTTTVLGGRVYNIMGYSLKKLRRLNDVSVLQPSATGYEEKKLRVDGDILPLNKDGHTANLVNDMIYVLGGSNNRGHCSDVFALDTVLEEWLFIQMQYDEKPILNMHTSQYFCKWNQILCFGGKDGETLVNSVCCLDISSHRWSELRPNGAAPEPRGDPLSCLIKNCWFIYGGRAFGPYNWFNDMHVLHLGGPAGVATWSSIATLNPPALRVEAALGALGDKLILYGGFNKQFHDDIHLLNLDTKEWSQAELPRERWNRRSAKRLPVAVRGIRASPRRGHTLKPLNDTTLILYGGSSLDSDDHTLYTLTTKD